MRPRTKYLPPIQVVVENSGPARPQSGLQQADMVFEYLSEYGITRMTALFFKNVSPLLRSVRSCRMINGYLDFAFDGFHLCSGVSAGTYSWLMGKHHKSRMICIDDGGLPVGVVALAEVVLYEPTPRPEELEKAEPLEPAIPPGERPLADVLAVPIAPLPSWVAARRNPERRRPAGPPR